MKNKRKEEERLKKEEEEKKKWMKKWLENPKKSLVMALKVETYSPKRKGGRGRDVHWIPKMEFGPKKEEEIEQSTSRQQMKT